MAINCLNYLKTSVIAALLASCATSESATPTAVAGPTPTAATAPSAQVVETESADQFYSYNAIGKRDPFRDMFCELEPGDKDAKRQPLEKFDLDQLKLVAVVVGTAAPRAMIEDPTGKGHVVKIGTLVGKASGQVKHIRPDGIIVREEFRTHTGQRVEHLITLRLPVERVEEM